MSQRVATLDRMSKPRKGRPAGKGPKKPNRSGTPLHVYIPLDLRAAIDALADDCRRPLTTEVIIALENHLKAAGRWPPPSDSAPPPG